MSLPNPSMDFTPFDPLTAAELDDFVENDQALAAGTGLNDGAITTAKVANSAVTASKIDFTTFTSRTSTDANGYSVTDLGAFKIATKLFQVNGLSVTTAGVTITSAQALPSALATIGAARSFQYSFKATGFSADLAIVDENADANTTLTFVGRSITTRTYDIDIWVLFII